MVAIPKELLKTLTTISPLPPWQLRGAFAVGGLWAVGFGPGSDLLLVVSVNGRGVFDCISGNRIARDSGADTYDEISETAAGLGLLDGSRIEVVGKGGGIVTQRTLPLTSGDGWVVANALLPANSHDGEGVFLRAPTVIGDAAWAKIAEVEEIRAIGFSPTGRTVVVAEPHTLHIWGR